MIKMKKTYLRKFLSAYYTNRVFNSSLDIADELLKGDYIVQLDQAEDMTDKQMLADFLHENLYSEISWEKVGEKGAYVLMTQMYPKTGVYANREVNFSLPFIKKLKF